MKIKILLFSVFCSLSSVLCFSQTPEPEFAWVKRFGTASSAHANVNPPVIEVDEEGNSYVSGVIYQQSFTIDGIALTSPIPLTGTEGCGYIAKYDPQGQIIWAKSMLRINALVNDYYFRKIIVDKQGNVYLCGIYILNSHSVLAGHYLTDPDEPLGEYGTQRAYFVAKLDTDGNVLWTKKSITPLITSGIVNYMQSAEIHLDLDGNINLTGVFSENITFNPDHTFTTDTNEIGVFLMKYSPDGDILAAKKLEGESYPRNQYEIEKIRSDASGNLYRWSSQNYNNPKTLYRYDARGELIESVPIDVYTAGTVTGKGTQLYAFDVSPAGDVIIGGGYIGILYINGTVYPYTVFQPGAGHSSGVIFKLAASDYSTAWVNTIDIYYLGTSFRDIITDPLGNIYASGRESNMGNSWLLLQKLDADGNVMWKKEVAGRVTPQTPDLKTISSAGLAQTKNGGNIWATGYFTANIYFGEGYHFTVPARPSYGDHKNSFLVQYGVCDTANPVVEATATELCEGGDSLRLSAELSDPELTYFWSTPTGNVAVEENTTTATLTVTQPGKYYLVAQEDEECFGKSEEIWVTYAPLPNNEVILEDRTLTAVEDNEVTYQWLDCDTNNSPIDGATAQSFTPSVSGTYAVEVTSIAGCSTVSDCVFVCNPVEPVIETPAETAFCEGGSMVLTAQITDPDLTYIWNTPQGSIPIADNSLNTLTVTEGGDYSLTVQESETCSATSEILSITENPLPVGEVILDGSTLSAQYGSEELTYQWLDCDNDNYPIPNETGQSFTPSVSGTYAVEVTNALGCSIVSDCVFVCNPVEPVIETPAETAFCEGGSMVLTAQITDPDLTYIWNTPQGSIPIADNSLNTLTVTEGGDYSLTVQESETCSATSEILSITENPLPVGEVILDGSTLSAQYGSEELTYHWLDCDNDNYPIPNETGQSFTPSVSGTYAVEVTSASGCSTVSDCVFVCNPVEPVIETPAEIAFCEGGSMVLTAQITDPDLTYIWNTPQGSIPIADNSLNTLTVTEGGDYSLTVQESETCSATSEILSITENPLPVGEVILDGSTLSAQYGTEELTYQWLDCDTNNSPIDGATAQSFTPSVSGTYAVEVTSIAGCSTVSDCIFVCNPVEPVIETPDHTAFCEGGSMVLTAQITDPDLTYIWNTPQGSIPIADNSLNTLTVTEGGDYSLTVQESETCSATSEILSITENPLPVGEVILDGSTLSAQYGSEELTYQWLDCDNDNYPIPNETGQSFTPSVSGTYAVEVTSIAGCSTVSDCVFVCNPVEPVIETPAETAFCEGGSMVLTAQITDPDLTYIWNTPQGSIPIADNSLNTLTVTEGGDYSLTVQESETCSATSEILSITENPLPVGEVILDGSTLSAQYGSEELTYQWLDCDNDNYPIPNETGQSFTPSVSGTYAVEVTNALGCSTVSECIQVEVLSVKDLDQRAAVLYPNPATTKLFLETPLEVKRLTVIDMSGKIVLKNRNSKEIDVSSLASGYYIITAKTDKGIWKGKFIKK